jgi:hypothetical protein
MHAHAQAGREDVAPVAAESKGFLRRRGAPVVVRDEPQPRGTLEHVHTTLQSPTARIVGAHASGPCSILLRCRSAKDMNEYPTCPTDADAPNTRLSVLERRTSHG